MPSETVAPVELDGVAPLVLTVEPPVLTVAPPVKAPVVAPVVAPVLTVELPVLLLVLAEEELASFLSTILILLDTMP
jgi:hypothetical protein